MGRALATVTIVLLAAPLGAQTLGELAAREKAKREEKAKRDEKARGGSPTKVYTNEDLGEDGAAPPERSAAGESAGQDGPGAEAAPPTRTRGGEEAEGGRRRARSSGEGEGQGEGESEDQGPSSRDVARDESGDAGWDARAREARAALSGAQARVTELEKSIEDLRARLNPASTRFEVEGVDVEGGGIVSRQAGLRDQLVRAESELEQAREALGAAERAWQQFVGEARSAGAPPSVLREPSP